MCRFDSRFRPGAAISGPRWDGRQASKLGSDEESAAVAADQKQGLASGPSNGALELRDVVDGLMVDFLDDVALLQARVGHFARRVDVGDNDAFGGFGEAEFAGGA